MALTDTRLTRPCFASIPNERRSTQISAAHAITAQPDRLPSFCHGRHQEISKNISSKQFSLQLEPLLTMKIPFHRVFVRFLKYRKKHRARRRFAYRLSFKIGQRRYPNGEAPQSATFVHTGTP
jgi:hypothetical protein